MYATGNKKMLNMLILEIDKMTDVHVLDEKVKPMSKVPELEKGLNLPKHMAEHFYMFSGLSVSAKIKTTEDMMSELVDWFGRDFRIIEKDDDSICIRVTCNQEALKYWALQYGPYVEIIEPQVLRNRILSDINEMQKKYSKNPAL